MNKFLITLCSFCMLTALSCKDDDDARSPLVITPEDTSTDPSEDTANDGRVVCEGGFADIYPCDGYDLMAKFTSEELGATRQNDIWGWTDPQDGKEYALIGTRQGTAFVDISNPTNPLRKGFLPTETVESGWRDIKTYNDHAFIVSEATDHGMQVFDLTRLRSSEPGTIFTADAVYTAFGRCHNIVINEERAYAYAVGSSTFAGGPHIIDISNPTAPTFAGGYADAAYTHDAQVVTYNGPDTDHLGKELYIGSNENELVVLDVTDPSEITLISRITYTNVAYTHQGWFTEDHQFFIVNDELDERDFGLNTRTLIFDMRDIDNLQFHATFTGPTAAIDHNLYVKGNEVFLSNYAAGVRVADISDIANGNVIDTGYFDTFPDNDDTAFDGVWSVYPYFESGNIIINDVDTGFYIVRKTGT